MEVRPQEQRLIELAGELPAGRALCYSAGRGQLAVHLANRPAPSDVSCFFLDLYQHQQAQAALAKLPGNLHFTCEADPPAGEFDLVALSFSKQGDAELTRDLLQAGHMRLAMDGHLAVAIDNPADQWLREVLQGMFAKVTRRPNRESVVYLATKTKTLKKVKDYSCELAFRDGERLIHLRTRPGVFSHREVDGGARALVKSMQILPGTRVLDLGCGSGAVGIAAALRAKGVQVHAIDSSPRAIEAARWAAERNAASNLTAALDCNGQSIPTGSFDLVLANPPYFSNFRIAALFVAIACRALAPSGKLMLVTKAPAWYEQNLDSRLTELAVTRAGHFAIVSAVRQ